MVNPRKPRSGSMQFWPRKRAHSEIARVRFVSIPADAKVEGFYGYKAGMVHISFKDTYANSMSKNQVVVKPATVIECPPLKVAGVRFYKISDNKLQAVSDIFSDKIDKELSRSMNVPKGKELTAPDYDDLRLIVYTVPKLSSLSKKKPEVFEISLGGKKEDKLAYAKEKLGKEIDVSEVFKASQLVDIHGISKGKGFQGPVKRFGVQIRSHKAEKAIRNPGSLGPWRGQQHIMYRVPHAGQTGYHQRTEYNKPLVYLGKDVEKVNPLGGYIRYGNVKSTFLIILGSVIGPKKRMVRLVHAIRPNTNLKIRTEKLQMVKVFTSL